MQSMLSYLYQEVYGDISQSMLLLSSYQRSIIAGRTEKLSACREILQSIEPALLCGDNFLKLIKNIDLAFRQEIDTCYSKFCSFSEPILSRSAILLLVGEYKRCLPNHYNTMKTIFGFDKKENTDKFSHLRDNFYYDRILFYQSL